uniref:Uncharacterized protein n=1 Tax=Nelumbo nucifera TaxID=4432 RepID=A0A822XP30_NELNU|nr:TPA_asm: hypothetical protein HUJ06_023255 [Nelumbo nucifera]
MGVKGLKKKRQKKLQKIISKSVELEKLKASNGVEPSSDLKIHESVKPVRGEAFCLRPRVNKMDNKKIKGLVRDPKGLPPIVKKNHIKLSGAGHKLVGKIMNKVVDMNEKSVKDTDEFIVLGNLVNSCGDTVPQNDRSISNMMLHGLRVSSMAPEPPSKMVCSFLFWNRNKKICQKVSCGNLASGFGGSNLKDLLEKKITCLNINNQCCEAADDDGLNSVSYLHKALVFSQEVKKEGINANYIPPAFSGRFNGLKCQSVGEDFVEENCSLEKCSALELVTQFPNAHVDINMGSVIGDSSACAYFGKLPIDDNKPRFPKKSFKDSLLTGILEKLKGCQGNLALANLNKKPTVPLGP